MKRIDIASGVTQTLADAANPRGGSWNGDGVIVFAAANNTGLVRVGATGGIPTEITSLKGGQTSHRYPQFLPDRQHFLYLALSDKEETSGVYLASLDSQDVRRIAAADSAAMFSPPSWLLVVRQDVLMAQRIDPGTGILQGDPMEGRSSIFRQTAS